MASGGGTFPFALLLTAIVHPTMPPIRGNVDLDRRPAEKACRECQRTEPHGAAERMAAGSHSGRTTPRNVNVPKNRLQQRQ